MERLDKSRLDNTCQKQQNSLVDSISELFGFKRELIEDAEQCGLWHVRFKVNGIKYYGWVAYHGAVPQISVDGYSSPYRWKGTPVTEEYYNEFISGKSIRLIEYIDRETGDWKWLDIYFSTPEEAEHYISTLEKPMNYTYDIFD